MQGFAEKLEHGKSNRTPMATSLFDSKIKPFYQKLNIKEATRKLRNKILENPELTGIHAPSYDLENLLDFGK